MTKDQIAHNQLLQEQALLRQLLPNHLLPNPLLPNQALPIPIIWKDHQLIFCSATAINRFTIQGYGGEIHLLVAFADKQIHGVRVVSHSETPGLGDFIDIKKSPWVSLFNKRLIATLEDEVDQVTGATITRNAMVRGVKAATRLETWSCS
jgi:electron transport complex protein RnfG